MKKIRSILFLFSILVFNCYILLCINILKGNDVTIQFRLNSNQIDEFQVFYSIDENMHEENSLKHKYTQAKRNETLSFKIPSNTNYIRFDIGTAPATIKIDNVILQSGNQSLALDTAIFKKSNKSMIKNLSIYNGVITFDTTGNDPFFLMNIASQVETISTKSVAFYSIFIKIFLCILGDIILALLFVYSKGILSLPIELIKNRKLIMNLAVNDFKTRYAGSYFGITWAFVQPIVTILIYWFVFQVAFQSSPVENFPFVLWLICGLVPWFFVSEALNSATNSLIEYSFLVKKLVFNISILPIIKLISTLFIQIFFIFMIIVVFALNGHFPDLYYIQLVYYLLCMFLFTLSISYVSSSIVIFFRDLGQIITIILQVGMWATPIMWSYTMIPDKFLWILKLNPIYYIVEGYRNSLINKIWFWEQPNNMICFWMLTILCFCMGTTIFRRLKVHFADVL